MSVPLGAGKSHVNRQDCLLRLGRVSSGGCTELLNRFVQSALTWADSFHLPILHQSAFASVTQGAELAAIVLPARLGLSSSICSYI